MVNSFTPKNLEISQGLTHPVTQKSLSLCRCVTKIKKKDFFCVCSVFVWFDVVCIKYSLVSSEKHQRREKKELMKCFLLTLTLGC